MIFQLCNKLKKAFIFLSLTSLLSACGGGGDENDVKIPSRTPSQEPITLETGFTNENISAEVFVVESPSIENPEINNLSLLSFGDERSNVSSLRTFMPLDLSNNIFFRQFSWSTSNKELVRSEIVDTVTLSEDGMSVVSTETRSVTKINSLMDVDGNKFNTILRVTDNGEETSFSQDLQRVLPFPYGELDGKTLRILLPEETQSCRELQITISGSSARETFGLCPNGSGGGDQGILVSQALGLNNMIEFSRLGGRGFLQMGILEGNLNTNAKVVISNFESNNIDDIFVSEARLTEPE